MCAERKQTVKKTIKRLIFSNDFYSDLETDGMLYGAIVRCPFATGIVMSISHPNLPDGYYLFTAADIPGVNKIETLGLETPVFCNGKVSYKGEPLGILAGPDEEKVFELLSEIKIVFDTSTIQSALKSFEEEYDRPAITLPGNSVPASPTVTVTTHAMLSSIIPTSPKDSDILARRTICTGAALLETKDGINPFESLFKEADHVVETTWSSSTHHTSYGETNGALCLLKNDMITLYTPTQWLSHLRKAVADVVNYDPDKIFVCRTNSSSLNTNTIWRNAVVSAQICIAVCGTGKPVKLMLTRKEQEQFMENTAPVKITHRSAVSKDGDITAMHVFIEVDAGAWNPFAQEILDRLSIAACGLYNPQNLKIEAIARRTSNPPSSVNLSTIDSQAFFAVENQMERISEITGILPVDLRLKNIRLLSSKSTDMPFLFTPGKVYETFDAVTRASDFTRKYTVYRLAESYHYSQNNDSPFAPPLRGIGLAGAFEGSGYYGTTIYSGNQSLEVVYNADKTLDIKTMPPSPSIRKIWTKIASDILGIPQEAVHLDSSFDENSEPQLPESINSNISIMTQLLRRCCDTVVEKKMNSTLPLVVKKTMTSAQKSSWDKAHFRGTPFHSTSFGAAVLELEFDPCTFRENIRGIWVAVDGGKILNQKAAETSIKLCIQQTLQELVENETVHCSAINVQFVPSDSDPKQIGDIVSSILPAAYTTALSQALASTVTTLPLKNDTLFALSVEARQKAEEAAKKAKENNKKSDQKTDVKANQKTDKKNSQNTDQSDSQIKNDSSEMQEDEQ